MLSSNQKEFILQIHSTFVRSKVPWALFRWRKKIQLKSEHRGNAINARSLSQFLRLCGVTPVVTFRDGERINMKTELIGNLEKIMGTNNVVWPNLPSHHSRRRSWLKAWRVWKIVLVSRKTRVEDRVALYAKKSKRVPTKDRWGVKGKKRFQLIE